MQTKHNTVETQQVQLLNKLVVVQRYVPMVQTVLGGSAVAVHRSFFFFKNPVLTQRPIPVVQTPSEIVYIGTTDAVRGYGG